MARAMGPAPTRLRRDPARAAYSRDAVGGVQSGGRDVPQRLASFVRCAPAYWRSAEQVNSKLRPDCTQGTQNDQTHNQALWACAHPAGPHSVGHACRKEQGGRYGNRPLEPKGPEVEFFPMEEVLHEEVEVH